MCCCCCRFIHKTIFTAQMQWLQWKIWGKETPFSAWAPAMRAGPIRCWCEWIFDAMFARDKQLSSISLHRRCHLVAYKRSCSVLPTAPVHFYELGGAGTPFHCVPRHLNHCSDGTYWRATYWSRRRPCRRYLLQHDIELEISYGLEHRLDQPHVSQSHWIRSEKNDHRFFLCMEEGSLSRTLTFDCGQAMLQMSMP